MKILFQVIIISLVFLFISCDNSNKSYKSVKKEKKEVEIIIPDNFMLKISNLYGAEGYGVDYLIKNGEFSILVWECTETPKKEVYKKKLSKKNIKSLIKFLLKLNIESLDPIYNNPNIDDGLQMTFEITIDKLNKKVILRNRSVTKLFKIGKKVNEMIPKNLKLNLWLKLPDKEYDDKYIDYGDDRADFYEKESLIK